MKLANVSIAISENSLRRMDSVPLTNTVTEDQQMVPWVERLEANNTGMVSICSQPCRSLWRGLPEAVERRSENLLSQLGA